MPLSVPQASFISVLLSMLRQTCCASGRSRTDSRVALSTTSHPSRFAAELASLSDATGTAGHRSMS